MDQHSRTNPPLVGTDKPPWSDVGDSVGARVRRLAIRQSARDSIAEKGLEQLWLSGATLQQVHAAFDASIGAPKVDDLLLDLSGGLGLIEFALDRIQLRDKLVTV